MRIGLVGLGAIGGALLEAAAGDAGVEVVGALTTGSARPRAPGGPRVTTRLDELLAMRPDVIVECAGQGALREHGAAILGRGIDLVPSSVGLLVDDAQRSSLLAAAARGGARVFLSGGAVCGLDGLLAARACGLEFVRYRFVMSPQAWGHAIETRGASEEASTQTVVYRGTAREAATRFPRHANVTATISLAGLGFDRTQVELVVDPAATANLHRITAGGAFGEIDIAVQGRRIAASSPSSRLVAGSLLATARAKGPDLAGVLAGGA